MYWLIVDDIVDVREREDERPAGRPGVHRLPDDIMKQLPKASAAVWPLLILWSPISMLYGTGLCLNYMWSLLRPDTRMYSVFILV